MYNEIGDSMFFKKNNYRKRILIKTKMPCLRELINNGVELTYKGDDINSSEGRFYYKNFGDWRKHVKELEYVILGENSYDFNVSRYIKSKNKKCKVIVYYWNKLVFDSYFDILNDPNVDEFYTFDEEEAEKYNFKFNTTYYSKRVKLKKKKIKYDVLFLGRAKDRYDDLMKLDKQYKELGINTLFKVITDEKDYIDYYDYLDLIAESKSILDFNAYNQVGLSLRTMEALFFKKKLITNNENVKNYDFYNKNNIFILGKDNIKNLNKFINSKYVDIDQKIIDYYDFDNWIERFKLKKHH